MHKAKYLIKVDGDKVDFSNLQKENIYPVMLTWRCRKCEAEMLQNIEDDAPTHCYYCEAR